MLEPQRTDLEDIQGIVYSGWLDHPYAGYLFARFGTHRAASRAWLASVAPGVTPAARHLRPADGRLQIALSVAGLGALGVPGDVLDAFPAEAQAGMAARRQALADPDPATWQLGGPHRPLHVLVMVYARDAEARARALAGHRAALHAAGAQVYPDELTWPVKQREHFGFADGLSQPFLPGLHGAPRPGEDRIPAGEILLGYPNAYDQVPSSPTWRDFDLGRNGSFLVFRKLAQDVAAFWGWIADHARRLTGGDPAATAELTELLGAKLIGRWRSGAPLALSHDRDNPAFAAPEHANAFKYLAHDPDGLICPVSSHIRRANPRDARGGTALDSETVVSRHRILRRGRSYGAPLPHPVACTGRDDGVPRGLYFLCLQSSIARGFEFIQQSWLVNPGFGGLYNEPDPIIGDNRVRAPDDEPYHITIPAQPFRLRLGNVPAVVTSLGGDYFFVPSLSALRHLATAG
ncbi:MAG TPA: Dyp-type peroxidase [Kofleriaceae bacterium]|nr:Dyp-type peroxidase [Kofleriaceae bacterium]